MNKKKSVFDWIIIAKGIGIILVVIGHFYPNTSPEYWSNIRAVIYTFHMPLFFLLSGYLYIHGKYNYATLIKSKVRRLLYPFLSIAVLFFIIKYISGMFVELEVPIGIQSVYALLVTPSSSYMPLLWFVYALFMMFLIYPLLRNIINNDFIILAAFVFINLLFGSDYMVIGNTVENIPFFIAGVILRDNKALWKRLTAAKWSHIGMPLVLFTLTYLAMFLLEIKTPLNYIFEFTLGLMGTLFIINISYLLNERAKPSVIKSMLMQIGFYSMTIYLFHTLFESAVRIGFDQVLSNFHPGFIVVAFFAITSGVVFPLLLEKMVLLKNRFTKKYVLGLS